MRLDDFQPSDNVEDRRGRGGGVRAGGLGLGGVVLVLVVSYFTGISPATLIGGYEAVTGNGGYSQEQTAPRELTPDQQASGRFVGQVLKATEVTWTALFQEQTNAAYTAPRLVLFDGQTDSGCGGAESAMGPFYCPTDRTVYLDTAFFDEMRSRFNACPATQGACAFAQAYVIAHEIGHHVQNLAGILPKVHQQREQVSEAEGNRLSVKTELQADCFAGVWANRTEQQFKFIEEGDVAAALQTANAIGDDMLQKKARGRVVPDSFTHGTSEQRQRWFMAGFRNGQIKACNTFSATQL